jgi:Predicted ATPase with chaperone activity
MKNLYNALQLKQLYQLKNMGYCYTSAKPFSHKEQNPLELPNNLEELKKQAKNCHLCSLSKSCKQALSQKRDPNADIMFLGAMNPCPCGNALSKKKSCRCSEQEIKRYKNRLSDPFLDRIDLFVVMQEVSSTDKADISSKEIKNRLIEPL